MKREIVGFDLDSVICDTELVILDYLKKKHNLYLELEDLTDYELNKVPYLTEEMVEGLEDAIHTGSLVKYMRPYCDVYEGFNLLHKEGFDIHILTSREKLPKEITTDWLKRYEIDYDGLHIIHKTRKWERLYYLNAKAFTEDHFGTINYVLQSNIELPYGLIVMDQPWNHKYFHKDVTRVYSFLDACEYIVMQRNLLNLEVK